MKASYHRYVLEFKRPSGTSRGILKTKETWLIVIDSNGKKGIGECGLLRGLSIDDRPDYEEKLQWTCRHIHWGVDRLWEALVDYPSIQFGVEMALLSLECEDPFELFPSAFTRGQQHIPINGLIWMGSIDFMKAQFQEKIAAGFDCIKMKIGAIDFDTELALLRAIRDDFPSDRLELRVDANGAFAPHEAQQKLAQLATFGLHSIEQPIAVKHPKLMQQLCKSSPIPIALDEELIGVFEISNKRKLLETLRPQYVILKPSLIGGFRGTKAWITIAEALGIKWWITSALESDIGLNAIAQFTAVLGSELQQGLGTGSLFTNNFESPLSVQGGTLTYVPKTVWNVPYMNIKN